jgi:hypothetical protein
MRGQAGGAELVAEAELRFRRLCRRLALRPPAAALAADELLPLPATSAMEVDSDGGAAPEGAASEEEEGGGLEVSEWPADLLAPAQWPLALRARQLAEGSLAGGVLRDGALLEALLLQLAAAQLPAGGPGAAAATSGQAAQHLAALPSGRLAQLLHASGRLPGAPPPPADDGGGGEDEDEEQGQGGGGQRALEWLQLVARAAAAAYALRASPADAGLRGGWAAAVSRRVQASAAALGAGPLAAGTARLAAAVVAQLLAHPLVAGPLAAAAASEAGGGAAGGGCWALQPVDARYGLQLAAAPASAAASAARRRLAALLAALQAAVGLAAAEAEARHAAEGAVHAGEASAYQLSCYRCGGTGWPAGGLAGWLAGLGLAGRLPWLAALDLVARRPRPCTRLPQSPPFSPPTPPPHTRARNRYSRPQERARAAAPHPATDWLHPALQALLELQAALLQPPAALALPGGALADLAAAQQLAAEAWHCCHGASLAAGGALPTEPFTWAWAQLAKRVGRLAAAAAAAPGGAAPQVSEALARWAHVAAQVDGALGLAAARDRPLLWLHGGHPLLPVRELGGALAGPAAWAA